MIYPKEKTTGGLTLRSLDLRDAVARARFFCELHDGSDTLASEQNELSVDTELIEAVLDDIEQSPDALELGVFDGRLLCALATLSPVTRAHRRKAHRCIVAVGVLRDYRRRGLAMDLLERVLSYAMIAGYTQAELSVTADNCGAIRLYERLGFAECGRIPNALRFADGHRTDEVLMVKGLDA